MESGGPAGEAGEADRAAGVDRDEPEAEGGAATAAGPPDPAAIASLATEIQANMRKRERLADELASLDGEHAELKAKLMQMLGKAGVQANPTSSAPPALPAAEFFPKAAWRRPE